jgi:hypothetical protein
MPASETIRNHAAFIWSVADLPRGDYTQSEYGRADAGETVEEAVELTHLRVEQHFSGSVSLDQGRG